MHPDAVERRLDELQQGSRERQAELRALAARVPAEMSRRQLVKQMAISVRDAPDRPTVISRTVAKVLRTPGDIVRSLRTRS